MSLEAELAARSQQKVSWSAEGWVTQVPEAVRQQGIQVITNRGGIVGVSAARELAFEGRVKVEHIDTKLNSSDLLTKPLPLPVFEMHKRRLMGMG